LRLVVGVDLRQAISGCDREREKALTIAAPSSQVSAVELRSTGTWRKS
jgi:hypothetical protein